MMNNTNLSEKQQEIIEASLELLNEKGYNELSLRDIAKKLNVKAPAIYWHFKNKAMLVDYMAEYILQKEMGEFKPRLNEQAWADWLIYHVTLLRKAMLSYRDGGRIVAGAHLFPAVTLAKLMECSLVSLRSAGMDLHTAKSVVITTIRYTFGYVIEEQSDKHSLESQSLNVTSIVTLTNLMEAINLSDTEDEKFKAGLELIINGAGVS